MKFVSILFLFFSYRCFAEAPVDIKESDIEALTKTMNAENRAKFENELKKDKGATSASMPSSREMAPPPPPIDLNSLNTNGMSASDKEMLKNVTEQMNQLKTMTEEMQKELDD